MVTGHTTSLIGARSGRLTITGRAPYRNNKGNPTRDGMWHVRCDCGNTYVLSARVFRRTQACHRCRYKTLFQPGDRSGCLTVVAYHRAGVVKKAAVYECKCDCGTTRYVRTNHLKNRIPSKCMCQFTVRHGWCSRRPEKIQEKRMYKLWTGIKNRCYKPCNPAFAYYGGRGIKVCDRWLKFENFLQDMGCKKPGLSVDRIDPDGDYSPENCRWADKRTQSLNRGFNKAYRFHGETLTLAQWLAKIQQEGELVALPMLSHSSQN